MKIISMYLPQFHRILENDLWWGEGFTEWTNLKKAKPLFKGHNQPRVPLNMNYYDLSDSEVIINQMKMANEYGIDGFAIYHYWFKGKKLLEKPVEKLIENNDLPIEFCLCWANEPWTRTWDGNVGAKEVLINQDYGNETDWEEHYKYLSTFFKHPNYIKKNNKPVILIYSAGDIQKQREMYLFWKQCAIDEGYNGIEVITAKRKKCLNVYPTYGDAIFNFEPFATLRGMPEELINSISDFYKENGREYRVIDYKKFCSYMVRRESLIPNNYYGLFVGWDNSPRVGKRVSILFSNNTIENFEYAFEGQYKKSITQKKEYLFINAWNEWCESTYLEPDVNTKFGYLEKIKKIKDKYDGL